MKFSKSFSSNRRQAIHRELCTNLQKSISPLEECHLLHSVFFERILRLSLQRSKSVQSMKRSQLVYKLRHPQNNPSCPCGEKHGRLVERRLFRAGPVPTWPVRHVSWPERHVISLNCHVFRCSWTSSVRSSPTTTSNATDAMMCGWSSLPLVVVFGILIHQIENALNFFGSGWKV